MLEAEAANFDHVLFVEAIQYGLEHCTQIAEAIHTDATKYGKTKRKIPLFNEKLDHLAIHLELGGAAGRATEFITLVLVLNVRGALAQRCTRRPSGVCVKIQAAGPGRCSGVF